MRVRITKNTVNSSNPKDKNYFYWDSNVKGFGLKVTPKGNKIYVLQYRINGRLRRYTIGKHGSPWTPDKARKEAVRLLGLIADGKDPAEQKSEKREDMLLSEVGDLWLSEGSVNKKASTLEIDRSNFERHIKPLLGKKSIRSITRADVERFQRDVANGKTAVDQRTKARGRAIVKGGKGTAARALGVLSAIFSFAVRRGMRSDNPARGVVAYKGQRKERYLLASEIGDLGEALESARKRGTNPVALAAIKMLLLTGARKSEILTLRWQWVDFENCCLRLPVSKTGAKNVPLGAPALKLLGSLERVDGNQFVFPGKKAGGHLVGIHKIWKDIRKLAKLENVRLHDLRHSFASIAVAGGDSLYLVGKVLGHRQARTTEIYAHLADDPLRRVADRTSKAIEAAMDVRAEQDDKVDALPEVQSVA